MNTDELKEFIEIRECKLCQSVLALNEFPFSGGYRKDGTRRRSSYCRECKQEYDRNYWFRTKSIRNQNKNSNAQIIRERNRQFVSDLKNNAICATAGCAVSDPEVLQFHHKDPSTKTANVADLVSQCASIERIKEEVYKCVLLCANCHQKVTLKQSK